MLEHYSEMFFLLGWIHPTLDYYKGPSTFQQRTATYRSELKTFLFWGKTAVPPLHKISSPNFVNLAIGPLWVWAYKAFFVVLSVWLMALFGSKIFLTNCLLIWKEDTCQRKVWPTVFDIITLASRHAGCPTANLICQTLSHSPCLKVSWCDLGIFLQTWWSNIALASSVSTAGISKQLLRSVFQSHF